MRKKRAGMAQKDKEEAELLAVFNPEPEAPIVRETYGEALSDDTSPKRAGDEGASLAALFSGSKSPPESREGIVPVIESPTQSPTQSPETSVDNYIRDQVLTEMYGTTTPSEHDTIQLALRRML